MRQREKVQTLLRYSAMKATGIERAGLTIPTWDSSQSRVYREAAFQIQVYAFIILFYMKKK